MSTKIVKYGLKHKKTGKVLGFYTSSNSNGEYCCDTQYILDQYSEETWTTDTPEHAEWVRNNSTEWYNAGYATPTHHFKAKDLTVVKLKTEVEDIEVAIPTFEEFAKWHSKGNKEEYGYYMDQKKTNPTIGYDLYHLQEMLRRKDARK